MKKLIVLLLILVLLLPIVSCAKTDTPPNEPQDSGSDNGTDSDTNQGEINKGDTNDSSEVLELFAPERRLDITCGDETVTPISFLSGGNGYSNGIWYDLYGNDPIDDKMRIEESEVVAEIPVLRVNGEICITTSEDWARVSVDLYEVIWDDWILSYRGRWREISLDELNELPQGEWYVRVRTTWNKQYVVRDEKFVYSTINNYFRMIVEE